MQFFILWLDYFTAVFLRFSSQKEYQEPQNVNRIVDDGKAYRHIECSCL
jgi:hypothetical protein